jgi:hypothetical protein
VFGFTIDDMTAEAGNYRQNTLCPFFNKIPKCTKNSVTKPLGVCSVYDGAHAVITCPIRFRQYWYITADAATFFFPAGTLWTPMPEIRLKDRHGKHVGNIDFVLVSHDEYGRVTDFASLEVQAVYISGNVTGPFDYYMSDPVGHSHMVWENEKNAPRPDYLSSSLKRLVPQLVAKGSIMRQWQKKQAVAVQRPFYETLPSVPETSPETADMVWLVYDLEHDESRNRFNLVRHKTVYTHFDEALLQFTTHEAGPVDAFVHSLQARLKQVGARRSLDNLDLGDVVVDDLH